MIAQLILNNPKLIKNLSTLLLFIVTVMVFFTLGIGSSLVTGLVPALGEYFEQSPHIFELLSSCLLGLVLFLNWKALKLLSRKAQIYTVWIELFVLLMVFFYSFDLSIPFILSKISFLITQGVVTTLYISAISIVIATVIALVCAIAKLSKNGAIYGLASFYTSFFRGLPLLMQIYIIYLGLPQIGYVVGPIPAGIIALSLCYGAYMAEIFRAGIQSIPRGQTEGAEALGLGSMQTMFLVILPQAMRVIIPPTGNQFIAMLKDSSLVSVIGVWELMYLARTLGQSEFKHIEMLITAAMIYWILSISLEFIQARIEQHFGRFNLR